MNGKADGCGGEDSTANKSTTLIDNIDDPSCAEALVPPTVDSMTNSGGVPLPSRTRSVFTPEWLTTIATIGILITSVVAAVLALQQLKRSASQNVAQANLQISQQQNAIVMQLWERWDDTLNYQTTRADLRAFSAWYAQETDEVAKEKWTRLFAMAGTISPADKAALLHRPTEALSSKFGDPVTERTLARVRDSLVRFLNTVEQASVAYLNEFARKEVMEANMVPTLRVYGKRLKPFMDVVREMESKEKRPGEKATWQAIYDLNLD